MSIDVKDIIIKRIQSKDANEFVKKWHYSGKIVNNSQLHFGAFYDGLLHGVLSFGASMDQNRTALIVKGSGINDFTELNRMAFDNYLPRNSESRCISICLRLIKKHCPHVKWVLSYADGTQCGDGTIYRASGFLLTSIKKNNQIHRFNGNKPKDNKINDIILNGEKISKLININALIAKKSLDNLYHQGRYLSSILNEQNLLEPLEGYQLRYIYFIDKSKIKDLSCKILPYSAIEEYKAGMYKGQKITRIKHKSNVPEYHSGEGGAVPTYPLQK